MKSFYTKIFLSISLLVCALNQINAVIYLPEHIQTQQVRESERQIFTDLHDVVAQKEPSRFGKSFAKIKRFTLGLWQSPTAIVSGLYNIAKAKITGTQNSVTLAMKAIKELPKSADFSGEAYLTIFEKYNLPGLAKIVEHISNAYRPQPGMQEVVDAINKQGITQRYASNIGPRLFVALNNKFKTQYGSNLLESIAMGKFVDYSKYGKEPLKNPGPELTSVGKPDMAFFDDLIRTYATPDKNEFFVFVDDKLESVEKARCHSSKKLVGIHFDLKNKNPMEAYKKDLAELGINA
jgi:hypothetical protein